MTRDEFITAYKQTSRDPNAQITATFPAPIQWAVLTEFYISSELDAVCTGSDRHRKFARWVRENEPRISHAVNERYTRNAEKIAEIQMTIARLQRRIECINLGIE